MRYATWHSIVPVDMDKGLNAANGCTTSCPAAKELDNVLAYYADASTLDDKNFARNLHAALPEHLRPAALFHGTEVPQNVRDAQYHAYLSGAAANYVPSADPREFGYEDRDGNWHPMAASSKDAQVT